MTQGIKLLEQPAPSIALGKNFAHGVTDELVNGPTLLIRRLTGFSIEIVL